MFQENKKRLSNESHMSFSGQSPGVERISMGLQNSRNEVSSNLLSDIELDSLSSDEREIVLLQFESGCDRNYLTKTALMRKRGWTHGMIATFVPVPCQTRPNRYNRKTPIHLYSEDRIVEVEKSEAFKAAVSKVYARKARSKTSSNKRKESLRARVISELVINLPKWSQEELVRASVDRYNENRRLFGELGRQISVGSPGAIIDRVCVDLLITYFTNYDELMERRVGRAYRALMRSEMMGQVLAKISVRFPFLGHECDLRTRLKVSRSSYQSEGFLGCL